MKRLIADEDLRAELLPAVDDRGAVFSFAMTFDGYKHFGSFEAAAANVRGRPRATLTDLRNELFMSARGSRHRGDDKFLETYRELLPLFQQVLQHDSAGN